MLTDVVLETTADDSGVIIEWSIDEKTSFDNFTLLYCVGEQDDISVCYVSMDQMMFIIYLFILSVTVIYLYLLSVTQSY